MTYELALRRTDVLIRAADLPRVKAAIDPDGQFKTFDRWLEAHSFFATYEPAPYPALPGERGAEDGDLVDLDFMSGRAGDEQDALRALAPFFRNGSWVEFDADGEAVRYIFTTSGVYLRTTTLLDWASIPKPPKRADADRTRRTTAERRARLAKLSGG